MEQVKIGIIGGSGLYQMPELTDIKETEVDTPFGKPSDSFIVGTLEGERVAFLPRHGRGHKLTPTELPYRANIYALKLLGVEYVLSVSAVGSLREDYAPTDFCIPDQFFDRTRGRTEESTFFGDGIVGHITFAHPVLRRIGRYFGSIVQNRRGFKCPSRRHIYLYGRSGVFDESRIECLSQLGNGRYRDDEFAGSQTRPRSRNRLRDASRSSPIMIAGTKVTMRFRLIWSSSI